MAVGTSVKKGFSVANQSMAIVIVLFAFGLVWNLINIFYTSKFQTDPNTQLSVPVIVLGVLFILISIFMQGGSLGYVHDRLRKGSADFGAFTGAGGKYYLRLLLLGLLVALVVGVFVLLAAVAYAALNASAAIVATILAVLIGLVGVYFVILFFLAPYAVVGDDEKVVSSVRKSVSLVQKNFLAALGLAIILVAIGFILGLALGAVFALLSSVMPGTASNVVFAVLSSFVNAYLGLVVTGAFMSFYFSLTGNTGGAA